MRTTASTGIKLISQANEKTREAEAYQLYASLYPHIDPKKFMSFSEFYKPVNKISTRPAAEILAEAEQIAIELSGKR